MLVAVVVLGKVVVETAYGSDYVAAVPFRLGIAAYRVVRAQREPLNSAVKGMWSPDAVFRISSVTVASR